MKRRQRVSKTEDLSPKKKPDLAISTDLRSKIGYKLQTLLNGISTDSAWFIRSRRQLYADLIKEPQYPEIIINPTVVVKLEEPEQCSVAVSETPSLDFINSAKSRLTELLNKRQDSEKENSTSESIPSSSVKSKQLANFSIPKTPRAKKTNVAETFSTSHTEVLINQGQLQNAILEINTKKTKKKTKITASKSSQTSVSRQKQCLVNQKVLGTSRKNAPKHKTCINDNEIANGSQGNTVTRKSSSNSCASSSSQIEKVMEVIPSNSLYCDSIPMVSSESSLVLNENLNFAHCAKIDNSEAIDKSIDCLSVAESSTSVSTETNSETVFANVPCDPEVVLLGEKQPTYEVINLDEEEEVKEVTNKDDMYKCKQCGKAFFARSLLNFHLKMHGSDSVSSSLRSRRSYFKVT